MGCKEGTLESVVGVEPGINSYIVGCKGSNLLLAYNSLLELIVT